MKLDFSITDWYAFGLAIILSLLALRRAIATVFRFICPLAFQIWNFQAFYRIRKRVSQWSVKHLVYRSFFRHGSSLDTFTRAHTILFLSYLVSNLGYVLINTLDTAEAFSRAGVLAVINAVLLYVGPCLDFVATVLHLRLRIQKQIHATAGYMVAVLCTIHAAGIFSRYGWSAMDETHNLLAALVVALLGVYLMLIPMKALPAVFPYEFLLFTHHSMSVMIGYAIWRHIPADNHRIRVFLYGIAGIFLSSLALQTLVTLYRNHFWFQSVSLSKNGSFDYIQVKLTLRKPVKVEPGQYINLWIPLGPISSIQSHPFTVANWSPDAQKELKLFVEVNNGLTKTLRGRVELGLTSNIGIFTGPYGSRITVENYETIILIATGLGVVALTPYLQWLVHAARMREVRIAPVHLVWQIPSWSRLFSFSLCIS
ncbi:uncharacterized protein NECHADRAFT_55169 [Fusarium vanettenii 77-13-4]|uniref:ferric-chelate reductase (NADPH) n=1 Tax=Fusarium vanettenii (strain ATCC MYA-4622 / CBS 123669 / FGSC 9596 / NRRL 45880 / 77-13-4) TaxID=660122 RepID=C7ZBN8_FUSV7|nr:uncharacterized protein NECHADRAFT_55169 [Fusarium vanettenii 77-13-4]EEU38547.1 hypothetical protein NECHADRAFT_55169 [Fusarium vanettenii 77-13-4]